MGRNRRPAYDLSQTSLIKSLSKLISEELLCIVFTFGLIVQEAPEGESLITMSCQLARTSSLLVLLIIILRRRTKLRAASICPQTAGTTCGLVGRGVDVS